MTSLDDIALLRLFVKEKSEEAFATLVTRHIGLVYSAALRQTGNPLAAEEIAQAVFIILARKACSLGSKVVLSGWLYQTAGLTAANHVRTEIRRARREQEAYMNALMNENETLADLAAWQQIAPALESAMGSLSHADRNAIVLRYFENKNFSEVARALNTSEMATRKRVNRAVERLRKIFGKRGITVSAVAIVGAVSANSVQAAPAGLAVSAAAVAAKGATVSGSTLTLIKGALKVMAWTKVKMAVVVGVAAILAAGTATVVVKTVAAANSLTSDPSWADDPKAWQMNSQVLDKHPNVFILRPTRFPKQAGNVSVIGPDVRQMMTKDANLEALLSSAYEINPARMVLPPLPSGNFDMMLTLKEKPLEILQQEIKKRFGLVGHRETRDTDVLLLQVRNSNAPGLHPSDPNGTPSSSWSSGMGEITAIGADLPGFAGSLEYRFHKPVIDQTGFNGRYDIHIHWKPQAGESENDAYERSLQEQLGLELVPSNQPIEMLVVDRAN
ncbi:MAG TPA: TIGR03435 family protein [Verrucomicrobiae bacterium]|jgi:uncharacterized protein (TIGR03435 family)|nr:TIGR03435 family protein [Verrucomicrobiae bacterium]